MKRQQTSQQRGNLPPRINTPNNQDFIQDYFSAHHQPSPFSPAKSIDNNMLNNMYFQNNQMIPQNNGPMFNSAVDSIDNYDLGDKNNKHMIRGISTPTTPIHPMNDMNQYNLPVQFRNGYEMYGDPQQQLMTPPPYMRGNGPFMNGGHHENENMMVGMNHVMKEHQNNNLLSPSVIENTGGAQNNKKANLYKTELCRSFEETGHCRYGSKCQFAHSESELRHVDRHPKYKTEMCKTFWEQGTCPYGKRCCFIHTPRDLAKKEDAPGHTPTTPAKPMEKKTFPDANATIDLNKKKETTTTNINTNNNNETSNNLSEGETITVTEEVENTANNRSRSGSDSASATAASITEEIITTGESDEKSAKEEKPKSEEEKEKEDSDDKKEVKESNEKNETTGPSESTTETTTENAPEDSSSKIPSIVTTTVTSSAVPIKANNKNNSKGVASSFDSMAKTPTNQTFNYSTSFGASMNMVNNNYIPRRKLSSPPQRQTQRIGTPVKSLDMNANFNGVLGVNSMSYQPNSPLDPDFMFNNNMEKMGLNGMGMSTSFPANSNDFLDDKTLLKLQNLQIQNTPPHTPINGQRTPQNNAGMMSPLSTSFNQTNLFMKQPLNISTTPNSSNLFLKQTAAASPFTPNTPSSFLSPKQSHVGIGLPSIPLLDDEASSLKGPGSVSGKGSDYGEETKSNGTDENSTNANNSSNLFVKQAINTSKAGNAAHPFLKLSQKPSTPKNPSFLPSTPQSISTNFLGNASPLPNSRMGTSLPSTPIHPNSGSFNPSAIEDIFNGNNNTVINDFSGRTTTSGINIAASPFTPTNDLSQYMLQMSSARENSGLENIKSPSQLFYRPSSNSISAINATPNSKANGGFGNMTMGGGINMVNINKNRSESFDYSMLSPNGMNSYLSSGNPVSSPAAAFSNSLTSSFNNSFLANKIRSESVDYGQLSQLGHYNNNTKDNMVGSMPSISYLQSINEGIPDSPFSNHGSMHGSPLPPLTTTTLNDLSGGMENFIGGGSRRKSFPESSLMTNRLPTVPEGRHPNIAEEEEHLFNNNNLTDEGILKFSKEHFGLDDAHSKSLLGGQGSGAMDIKGSILGGNIFSPMSPTSNTNNFF